MKLIRASNLKEYKNYDPSDKSNPLYDYREDPKHWHESLKKTNKPTKSKQSKAEIIYERILNNPKIPKSSITHLKRNTKNGTLLNIEDLLAFESVELMDFSDSDEEEIKPVKKIVKPKTSREKAITKKGYSNVLKARSDMFYEDDKPKIKTELKLRKGLKEKENNELIKSIIEELNKNFDDYDFFYKKKN